MTSPPEATPLRRTSQYLIPAEYDPPTGSVYDVYPGFDVGPTAITAGFQALARHIAGKERIVLDGYVGIDWEDFRRRLDEALREIGAHPEWIDVSRALKSEEQIEEMVAPFLGGDDPLFGTRYTGTLADFFDPEALGGLTPGGSDSPVILYGCGAALARWDAYLVYIDLPKNELQFRSRAGRVCNLGQKSPPSPKAQYKRFYFVDWVALNRHKEQLASIIDLFVDGQRPEAPLFASGDVVRTALRDMAFNFFRARPWFEPGPWGGQWIREHIPGLSPDVPNYAWSFELISPENGLLLRSGRRLMEISFDFLMYYDASAVLGEYARVFGKEFPIRFDFLDTFDGGNLSLQCHPSPGYISKNFGENFTQDETYYILDCKPDAEVYLGFRDDIDPPAFEKELERSYREGTPMNVEKHVNIEPANKHDLFLIPHGTIHCSGIDNMVLEISATPYIFTFKMYDWMRMDLDGKPRPLNLERAFENLRYERKGDVVKKELISQPRVVEEGAGWRKVHLPTHPLHFYDVFRLEFEAPVRQRTLGSPHVMSLVEGQAVRLETAGGMRQTFHYAETFVVTAAAESYRLVPVAPGPLKVVVATLKTQVILGL